MGEMSLSRCEILSDGMTAVVKRAANLGNDRNERARVTSSFGGSVSHAGDGELGERNGYDKTKKGTKRKVRNWNRAIEVVE